MRHEKSLFAILGAVISLAAFADAPFATARIELRDPKTDKAKVITSARFGDRDVCIVIKDVSTEDGDHALRLVIYDGGGREVYQAVSTVTARDRKWVSVTCYGFKSLRDAPGTWWYVAELDDQPLVSTELLVHPDAAASAPARE
jgi:hypothetical protein